MNQQTIEQSPPSTWQDEDFIGLSKRQVEALCANGITTFGAEVALRQVSAVNIENVRMYAVGDDHIVIVVEDNSGVVRWGVMRRTSDEWSQLRSQLNAMDVSDWGFARAQALALRDSCFYSNTFISSRR